jgi:hypothetical protein
MESLCRRSAPPRGSLQRFIERFEFRGKDPTVVAHREGAYLDRVGLELVDLGWSRDLRCQHFAGSEEATMTRTAPTRRQSVATRRAGYVIAIVINAMLLYVVNVWPGWQAVSFLTEDTRQVLGLVNLLLAAGVVANVAYLAHDGPRLKALGDLVTTGIGLAALVRVWQVFPLDFHGWSYDWSFLVHVLLIVGMVGASIGILVELVLLLRQLANGGARPGART